MGNLPKKRRVRWGGVWGILILAAIAVVIGRSMEGSRQDHNLRTMIVAMVAATLLFLWAVLFSRFRGSTRVTMLCGGLAVGFVLLKSVEISGVTGDLIPIFRWKGKKQLALKSQATVSGPVAKTNLLSAQRGEQSNQTFPQFLGPERNGIIRNVALDSNWTEHPPEEIWRHEVGPGWTGFVVVDGIAVTQEQRGADECVTAYDSRSGQPIWTHADPAHYNTTIAGEGPRATPTIKGGKVYALGSTGLLNCLELATGKVIWKVDFVEEHSARVPEWGFAGAPLVADGLVIVNAGGKNGRSVVAHDAETGKFVWGGGDEPAGYSSPTELTLGGVKQAVVFNHADVAGHDMVTGKQLWSHPWPTSTPHCAMPIQISTNRLLASQGYGYGSELIEISRTNQLWTAERIWKSNRLKSKFANLILHRGLVYGLDDGILVCFDPAVGDLKWKGDRYGHGQMLLVGNVILLMAENGEVLLIEPSALEEKVVGRFRALRGKTWNPPALAGEFLFVRNDSEAACFKVRLASKTKTADNARTL